MDENVAFLATDIGRLFRKRADTVARPAGVTVQQLRVLLYLKRNPGANQAALASYFEIEPITAGRMIDRMAAPGLVERQADPNDRRAWRIFMTDKGASLISDVSSQFDKLLEEMLVTLDETQRVTLASLLRCVRNNLLELTEKPEKSHG